MSKSEYNFDRGDLKKLLFAIGIGTLTCFVVYGLLVLIKILQAVR